MSVKCVGMHVQLDYQARNCMMLLRLVEYHRIVGNILPLSVLRSLWYKY